MKQSIWNSHIEATIPQFDFEIKEDKSNISDFFCADVVGNRRFAQNYGGYPRSDIAEINAQTSLAAAENLLRDLQVFDVDNPNAGLSDEQIMLSHKSKYLQSVSETQGWLVEQLAIRDAKRQQLQESKDGTINFENDDSKVIDNV